MAFFAYLVATQLAYAVAHRNGAFMSILSSASLSWGRVLSEGLAWSEICDLPQIPLENKSIFSGALFQYLEENKKWKNHFLFVPDSYDINYYDDKAVRWVEHYLHTTGFYSLSNMSILLPLLIASPVTEASIPKESSTVLGIKCWRLWSSTWICLATACQVRRGWVRESILKLQGFHGNSCWVRKCSYQIIADRCTLVYFVLTAVHTVWQPHFSKETSLLQDEVERTVMSVFWQS